MDWKRMARELCRVHNAAGVAAVDLDGRQLTADADHVVNVSREEEILRVDGVELGPKTVRRWLWEMRRSRGLKRGNVVVWSVVDGEVSYVGVGASVGEQVARRLNDGERQGEAGEGPARDDAGDGAGEPGAVR